MKEELAISTEIIKASSAEEIIRVWLTDGDQTVLIKGSVWADPAAWGILLFDMMYHVATVYAAESLEDFDTAFARLKSGLQAELDQFEAGNTD